MATRISRRARDYIAAGAPVIGLRTFSKMYGLAGLRVGYGVARPEVIQALNQPRSPFNVNLAGQIAATAAVDDDTYVERGKQANTAGLAQLMAGFERLKLPYIPSHTNFIMVDTRRPCRAVFETLLRQGVIVRTGGHLRNADTPACHRRHRGAERPIPHRIGKRALSAVATVT